MIARHETHMDKMDIWSKLSAALPPGVISWRQDGKPVQRDGKYVARFVAYIEANTVRERLDTVVGRLEEEIVHHRLRPLELLDERERHGAAGHCAAELRVDAIAGGTAVDGDRALLPGLEEVG